jgi:hypothetical protein
MNADILSLSHPLTRLVLWLVLIFAFIGLNALILVWVERKVAGYVQLRPGPLHVGPCGLLQPLVDAVKLMAKQLVTPAAGDKVLFWAAPLLAFAPVTVCFLPLPFDARFNPLPMNLGLVLILSFSGLGVVSLCLAGWGSNNKWSLLGAARAVSQAVAYEVPLLLAVMAVAITAGSLDLYAITAKQGGWPWQWYGVKNPLAFFIFLVCAVARPTARPLTCPRPNPNSRPGSIPNIPVWASVCSSWPSTPTWSSCRAWPRRLVPGRLAGTVPARRLVVSGQDLLHPVLHHLVALDLPARAVRPAAQHQLEMADSAGPARFRAAVVVAGLGG